MLCSLQLCEGTHASATERPPNPYLFLTQQATFSRSRPELEVPAQSLAELPDATESEKEQGTARVLAAPNSDLNPVQGCWRTVKILRLQHLPDCLIFRVPGFLGCY